MLDIFRTLPALLSDLEGSEMIREAVVFAAWRRIAGEGLSEHAVPIRLENGHLTVAVSGVAWRRQLKDLSGQMLFKLNAALGSPMVSFLEFEVDEAAVLRDRTKAPEAATESEIENAITPELAAAATKIDDADLRRQFLLAAGSCLIRRDRRRSTSSM